MRYFYFYFYFVFTFYAWIKRKAWKRESTWAVAWRGGFHVPEIFFFSFA
jgi:hypothetical protein